MFIQHTNTVVIYSIPGKHKYLDAYRNILDNKDCIDMWFIKVILLGAPRLGKTTACRRLSGEISSSGEVTQPSTGIVESRNSIIVRRSPGTTAVVPPSHWFSAKDLNEEACIFLELLYGKTREKKLGILKRLSLRFPLRKDSNSQNKKNSVVGKVATSLKEFLTSHKEGRDSSDSEMASAVENLELASDSTREGAHELEKDVDTEVEVNSDKNDGMRSDSAGESSSMDMDTGSYKILAPVSSMHVSPTQPSSSTELSDLFCKAIDSKYWGNLKNHLKDMTFLKIEDTGGQLEFVDMLPALTFGPALYLLFCKLIDDLQSHYTVSHLSLSGQSTTPVESTHTVEDFLLTALASISCFKSYPHTPEVSSEETNVDELLRSLNESVAYIIGTHKDLVSKENIEDFDKKLQKTIRSTDFFREDLVRFSSKDRMILPIDNMYGGEDEINKIRTFLEDGVKKHFKKLSIPTSWLMLSLCLRKREQRTASLENVLQLAKELCIPNSEAMLALWFLHHYAGVLMYFPGVVELKDTVICDVQVVYDSVATLIVNTFKFGPVSKAASKRFRETGHFALDDVKNATVGDVGDFIPVQKLMKLLQHLNVIAVSSSFKCSTYFMPCVLQNATVDDLTSWWDNRSWYSPAPLFICYKSGFAPIGIFPAMIANLAGKHSLQLIVKDIWKNLVRFKFGTDSDTITFISHSKYYAAHIARQPNAKIPTHKLCGMIRELIESTLRTVTRHMNYSVCPRYQLSFECPSHPGRGHLCVVESKDTSPLSMSCLENPKEPKPVKMKDEHLVWFGKVSVLIKNITLCREHGIF